MGAPTQEEQSVAGVGPTGTQTYNCCAGATFFTREMQRQGRAPFCLGLGYVKEGRLQPDDAQAVPRGTEDYQVVCLGFAAHARRAAAAAGGKPPRDDVLPYCEGVELITYTESPSAAEAQLAELAGDAGPNAPMAATSLTRQAGSSEQQQQQQQQGQQGQEQGQGQGQQQQQQQQGPKRTLPTLPGWPRLRGEPAPQPAATPLLDAEDRGVGPAAAVAAAATVAAVAAPLQQVASGAGRAAEEQGGEGRQPGEEGTDPARRSFPDRFAARSRANVEGMARLLRNEGPLRVRAFESTQEAYDRLWQVGGQNARRMQTAAALAGGAVAERCGLAWQAVMGAGNSSKR